MYIFTLGSIFIIRWAPSNPPLGGENLIFIIVNLSSWFELAVELAEVVGKWGTLWTTNSLGDSLPIINYELS